MIMDGYSTYIYPNLQNMFAAVARDNAESIHKIDDQISYLILFGSQIFNQNVRTIELRFIICDGFYIVETDRPRKHLYY